MSGLIGPALPPGYTASRPSEEQDRGQSTSQDDADAKGEVFGPSLPPELTEKSFGPSLPPELAEKSFGPVLPPHMMVCGEIEPVLPADYDKQKQTHHTNYDEETSSHHEYKTSDMIGPMPAISGDKDDDNDRIKQDIELRSKYMRDKLLGKLSQDSDVSQPQREEWMTVLPPEFKPLGIGARKFRTTDSGSGDRSVWTDTPADRHRKQLEGGQKKKADKVTEEHIISSRDKEIAEHVDKYNKKYRSESLMELHRKRRAAEDTSSDGHTERRPFNREIDLEAPRNLVTPAKRRALVKDSRTALDKKFSRGTKSFL